MGLRLDSKCNWTPPIFLLGLLLFPWVWSTLFLVGYNILLLMVVQKLVEILVFLQEKMSSRPFTLPFCLTPKSFSIVNEIKVNAFLEFSFFF